MGLRQPQITVQTPTPLSDEEVEALASQGEAKEPPAEIKPLSDEEVEAASIQGEAQEVDASGNLLPSPFGTAFDPKIPTREFDPNNLADPKQFAIGVLEGLPLAGGIIGGTLGAGSGLLTGPGAVVASPAGALAGAGAGGLAGKAFENYLKSLFFPDLAPKTTTEAITQPFVAGAESMLGEGTGMLLSKGLIKGGKLAGELLKGKPKVNVEEIKAAAKRLNIPTTPGQLTESQTLQLAESALEQSPTIAGSIFRKTADKIRKGLKKTAGSLVENASGASKFETGEAVKGAITAKSGEIIQPAQMVYQELDDLFSDTPLNDRIKTIAINRLKNSDYIKLYGESDGTMKILENAIKNSTTLRDVKRFSTALYKALPDDAPDLQREFIREGLSALRRLKENALKENIDKSSRLAYKRANKIWSGYFEKIKDLDEALGGPKSLSPGDFLDKLNTQTGENVAKKLFNTNNVKLIRSLKTSFPEAAEELVTRKIAELEKVSKASKGPGVDPGKLMRNLEKIEPDVLEEIFGSNAKQILKDFRTIITAAPEYAGPSKTPQGLQAFQFGLPTAQGIRDMAKLGVLKSKNLGGGVQGFFKGAGEPKLQRLLNQTIFQNTLGDNE